jgi:hypothetical protein
METVDNEKLLRNLEIASSNIKKQVGGRGGEGIEKKYGQAYQECVKAGLKPQIRKRYR